VLSRDKASYQRCPSDASTLLWQVHQVGFSGSGRGVNLMLGVPADNSALKLLFHDTGMSGNRYFIALTYFFVPLHLISNLFNHF